MTNADSGRLLRRLLGGYGDRYRRPEALTPSGRQPSAERWNTAAATLTLAALDSLEGHGNMGRAKRLLLCLCNAAERTRLTRLLHIIA